MFFEPFHQHRETFEILSSKLEAVGRDARVLVPRVSPRHVSQHELAGIILAHGEEVVDLVWLGGTILKFKIFVE